MLQNGGVECRAPVNARGHLHQHKQRHDRTNRDREPREPFEEEGVAEEDQERDLRQARLQNSAPHAGDDAQVTDDQAHADQG